MARHLPQGHKLHKIFNRNTLKVSYNCMRNMGSIMQSHNSRIITKKTQSQPENLCNCRKKGECPLNGEFLTTSIVNKANVIAESEPSKSYLGIAGRTFKDRYSNHTKIIQTTRKIWKRNWTLQICMAIEEERKTLYHQVENHQKIPY